MVKRAAVIIAKTGPLVLVATNRKFGGISLPGGKVEEHESIMDAANRELQEEAGCHCPYVMTELCEGPSAVEEDRLVTVFYAPGLVGRLGSREMGTTPFFTTWNSLLSQSKFTKFYNTYFPRGVRHLKDTILDLD